MLRVIVLVATLAQIAHAQPGMTPVQAQPAPVESSVMARRWSVALALGPQWLTARTDNGATFSATMLDLAGHFRVYRELELGLGLVVAGSEQPQMSSGGLFFDVRYRFLAERPLNVYALAGLGVMSAARKDASDDAKQGRGALRVGVGVEWRFRVFALHGELRLVRVAGNKNLDGPPLADPVTDVTWQFSRYPLSGGSVTLGGAVYF